MNLGWRERKYAVVEPMIPPPDKSRQLLPRAMRGGLDVPTMTMFLFDAGSMAVSGGGVIGFLGERRRVVEDDFFLVLFLMPSPIAAACRQVERAGRASSCGARRG